MKRPRRRGVARRRNVEFVDWAGESTSLRATGYDAAQTTVENSRRWRFADSRSADGSNLLSTRKKIRQRARYVAANNSYCRGMLLTLAGDTIGNGPRPQVGQDQLASIVEKDFLLWAEEIRLAEKLRTMRIAKAVDGEAFALLRTNYRNSSSVKLDIELIEADRVTDAGMTMLDGITLDAAGNPAYYSVMTEHPGDAGLPGAQTVDASAMVHWFRCDRPEQHRGISELLPAIDLFEDMRRYTLAVLAAAETAADYAAVLYTDAPASGSAMPVKPLVMGLEKRMATSLPDGWKLAQVKAEQPVTNYPQFKREILGEIGRALQIPVNVVTGDSSQHNYASGRLDFQQYYRAIRIEQRHCESVVLSALWREWMREYSTTQPDALKLDAPLWHWDGFEHVDPAKEANAQRTRLGSLTTTLAAEYARQGKDWETALRQIAAERRLMSELGIDFMDGFDETRSYSVSESTSRRLEDSEKDSEGGDE